MDERIAGLQDPHVADVTDDGKAVKLTIVSAHPNPGPDDGVNQFTPIPNLTLAEAADLVGQMKAASDVVYLRGNAGRLAAELDKRGFTCTQGDGGNYRLE